MRLTWDSESLTVAFALDLLQTWLLRSRDYPLLISVDAEDLGDALRSGNRVESFLNVILPHASRWENVDLHMPTRPSAFSAVTSPSYVVLARSFWPADFRLPWPRFVTISAAELFPYECLGILRDAHVLVHFAVTLVQTQPGSHAPLPRIPPLSHLELIVLHHSGGRSVGQKLVLDALITHALRHLRISERMLGTTPPTLSALFTRSQKLTVDRVLKCPRLRRTLAFWDIDS
ncbi:hypothetical protein C8J57DRAFT_1355146 [Mycena rebaudengoi]|nr:hypothetical protein C8J57DRAFT_1355146 [Mycena rebaudengoi]